MDHRVQGLAVVNEWDRMVCQKWCQQTPNRALSTPLSVPLGCPFGARLGTLHYALLIGFPPRCPPWLLSSAPPVTPSVNHSPTSALHFTPYYHLRFYCVFLNTIYVFYVYWVVPLKCRFCLFNLPTRSFMCPYPQPGPLARPVESGMSCHLSPGSRSNRT